MSEQTPNWYAVLGVPLDATEQQVKRAYRRAARHTHSDVAPGSGDRFAQVAHAFEVLSDSAARARYDDELRAQGRFTSGTLVVATAPAAAPGASRGPAGARPAKAPVVAPTLRPFRWLAAAVAAVVLGNLTRFTGVPAAVFGFTPGERMLVGGRWFTVPEVDMAADFSTVLALLLWGAAIVIGCVPLVVGWWVRREVRPVPRMETFAALTALFTVSSGWEVLMVRSQFWHVAAWAAGGWLVWVVALSLVPAPASTAQWDSFGLWVRERVLRRRTRTAELVHSSGATH